MNIPSKTLFQLLNTNTDDQFFTLTKLNGKKLTVRLRYINYISENEDNNTTIATQHGLFQVKEPISVIRKYLEDYSFGV